jgi:hypothetical protein
MSEKDAKYITEHSRPAATDKGNLTMNAAIREIDVITSKDLPSLRAEMCAHIESEIFSDTFRATCQKVIFAIDQAHDEDEATHRPLKAALGEYMRVGRNELLLHNSCGEALPC